MELKDWCQSLRRNLEGLSDFSKKALPYSVETLLRECESAAAGDVDVDAPVKIAVVGAFSSGKSSFLNAVFDRDLTAVDVNRTTRCRTDFTYGTEFGIVNVRTGEQLSEEAYKDASKRGHAQEDSHYLVTLPDPRLKNIVFIDTPGFDPPKDSDVDKDCQDEKISRRAAQDADVCLFLLAAKDGTLQGHCLDYLMQLNGRTAADSENPLRLVVILNQADLKMPSARTRIMDNVADICRKNGIRVDRFLLHTARRPRKNPEFYQQCQADMWTLVGDFRRQKDIIAAGRKSVWARLSRQSLFDLRAVLEKFTEFQIAQIEKEQKENDSVRENFSKECIGKIAEEIGDLVQKFARDHSWRYSSNYMIDNSGIFDWDWTKDWKAYIAEDNDDVLPRDEQRADIKRQLEEMLDGCGIHSPDIYAERFLTDIDNFIISVFREDDGRGYYVRCGRSRVCATESEANKQSVEWQKEYFRKLDELAGPYFMEHVEPVLNSLLKSVDKDDEKLLNDDLRTCRRISRLLSSDFPSLQSRCVFQHPVLDEPRERQRNYLALLGIVRSVLDDEAGGRISELAKKIAFAGDAGIDEEQLDSMSQREAVAILAESGNFDRARELLEWSLADAGFCGADPQKEKTLLNTFKKLDCFKDVKIEECDGSLRFGRAAREAEDLWQLAELAQSCPNCPASWAYLMIDKGLPEDECRLFEAASVRFSWEELCHAHERNDFTFREDGSLLLDSCVWPFSRKAAEFLLRHGCDINAEHGGENVVQSNPVLFSDEAFEFLIDNGIAITDEAWSDIFMMNKSSLVEVAMRHHLNIPPQALFQVFMMNLDTLRAYGDNGGNLDIYSSEDDCSLIDYCVRFEKNDMVEYLRGKGLRPSSGAKSTRQILDELGNMFK